MGIAAWDRWELARMGINSEHGEMDGLRMKGMSAFARMDKDIFSDAINEL